jgi:hypothetical protein
MVVRIWHGWTSPQNAEPYETLLREEIFVGIADRKIEGFLRIQLLRRQLPTKSSSSIVSFRYGRRASPARTASWPWSPRRSYSRTDDHTAL